jgi:hypothetical protein
MSFFNIYWERKQLGGACFMHVPANVPCVFISESIQVRGSSCISLRGLSHKSSIAFLLTELFNIYRFKQASLYLALTFFVSTTPSIPFYQQKCFGNGTWGISE